MGVVLMAVLVLGGGIAAYGTVLLGLSVPAWAADKVLHQNDQCVQGADLMLKRGAMNLYLGLVIVAVAWFWLHQINHI